MLHNLCHILSVPFWRFYRDEKALMSVELILMLPLLFWGFSVSYVYFDVFRAKSLATKGNYAISDLLSRETNTVDASYIDGMASLYAYLTAKSGGSDSVIRATVVTCIDKCDQPDRDLQPVWSYATDGRPALTEDDIHGDYDSHIPLMALGETVIVMETTMHYTPKFSDAFTYVVEQDFYDLVTTRPRFVDNIPCNWPQSSSATCNYN